MKKKIYSGVAVLAVAAVAGWNMNLSSKTGDMSDVSLANVEALAQSEGGSGSDCENYSGSTCWYVVVSSTGNYYGAEFDRRSIYNH